MQIQSWFYRHLGWNGVTYYWPCHWLGALLMMAAAALAFAFASLVVIASKTSGHPALGWLSVVVVGMVYCGFDRIADRHARD